MDDVAEVSPDPFRGPAWGTLGLGVRILWGPSLGCDLAMGDILKEWKVEGSYENSWARLGLPFGLVSGHFVSSFSAQKIVRL